MSRLMRHEALLASQHKRSFRIILCRVSEAVLERCFDDELCAPDHSMLLQLLLYLPHLFFFVFLSVFASISLTSSSVGFFSFFSL